MSLASFLAERTGIRSVERIKLEIRVVPKTRERRLVTEGPMFDAVQSLKEYVIADNVLKKRITFEEGVRMMKEIKRR